jgi:serine/threonine protein kinase
MRAILEQFTEFFVHEFMEELWYLQKVARGDIPARKDAEDPWTKILNVTKALLSLAPVPGLPAALVILKEGVSQGIDLIEKVCETSEKVLSGIDTTQEYYEWFVDDSKSSGLMQTLKQGTVDLEAMRSLAELLGRGLSQRYEQILIEILDTTQPDKSTILLAREGARRCFQYLQSQPFLDEKSLSTPLLVQRFRLLNSVNLGKMDKSWREQVVDISIHRLPRWAQNLGKEKLAVKPGQIAHIGKIKQTVSSKAAFTAQEFYTRSAWYSDKRDCYQSIAKDEKTNWQRQDQKSNIRFPKFGYAYLEDTRCLPLKELKRINDSDQFEFKLPSRETRFYQPVTVKEITAYLQSEEVKTAKEKNQTAVLSFHEFLHQEYKYPQDCQAVCHEDLTGLTVNLAFGNFTRVDFSGAKISRDVSGCCFDHSYLVSTIFTDIKCDVKSPLRFEKANLSHAQLVKAPLMKANLTQANLSFANLEQANLIEVQIFGTQWYKTQLRDIQQEQNLLSDQKEQHQAMQIELKEWQSRMDERALSIEKELEPMVEALAKLEAKIETAQGAQREQLKKHTAELMSLITQQASVEWVKQYLQEELEKLRTTPDQAKAIEEVQQKLGSLMLEKEKLAELSKNILQFAKEIADLKKITIEHDQKILNLSRGKSDLRIQMTGKITEIQTALQAAQAKIFRSDTENLEEIHKQIGRKWLDLKQSPDFKGGEKTEQSMDMLDEQIKDSIKRQKDRLNRMTYHQEELEELCRLLPLTLQLETIRKLQTRQEKLQRELASLKDEKASLPMDFRSAFRESSIQLEQLIEPTRKLLNEHFNAELKALDAAHTEKLQQLIIRMETFEKDLIFRLQEIGVAHTQQTWVQEVEEIKTDYPKIKPVTRQNLQTLQDELLLELRQFMEQQQTQQIQQQEYQKKINDLQIKIARQVDTSHLSSLRDELKSLKESETAPPPPKTQPVSDKLATLQAAYRKEIKEFKHPNQDEKEVIQKLKQQAEHFAQWQSALDEQKDTQLKMHGTAKIRLQQELETARIGIEQLSSLTDSPELVRLRQQILLRDFLSNVKEMIEREAKLSLPEDKKQDSTITQPQVFLSYAWETDDLPKLTYLRTFLTQLADDLKTAGLSPWLDLRNMSGNLEDQMRSGIRDSQYVLLIGTSHYAKRTKPESNANVRKELDFTLAEAKKSPDFLMPLMLEGDYGTTFPTVGEYLIHDCRTCYPLEQGAWKSFENYIKELTRPEPLGILPCLLGLNRSDRQLKQYRDSCVKQYWQLQSALMNALALLSKPRNLTDSKPTRSYPSIQLTPVLQIPSTELEYDKKDDIIGSGSYGEVYRGWWQGKQPVAVKELTGTLTTEAERELYREAGIMAHLAKLSIDPLTVRLFGIVMKKPNYALVMEYVPNGTLFDLMQLQKERSKEKLPWDLCYQLAADIANGIALLHSQNILHRDLRSHNILLNITEGRLRAKLSDFGLSTVKHSVRTSSTQRKTQNVGTLAWMAPELHEWTGEPSSASDIYSFGMVLWELLTHQIPFARAQHPMQISNWVLKGQVEKIPADCPPELKTLIEQCWKFKPEDRIQIKDIQKQLAMWVEPHPSVETQRIIKTLQENQEASEAKWNARWQDKRSLAKQEQEEKEAQQFKLEGLQKKIERLEQKQEQERIAAEEQLCLEIKKQQEADRRQQQYEIQKSLDAEKQKQQQREIELLKLVVEQEQLKQRQREIEKQEKDARLKAEQEREIKRREKELPPPPAASKPKTPASSPPARQMESQIPSPQISDRLREKETKKIQPQLRESQYSLPQVSKEEKELKYKPSSLPSKPPSIPTPKPVIPPDRGIKPLDQKSLSQLLQYVAEGEQDKAEELIIRDKNLLLHAGTVKDLSGREFESITPFQYALWAVDYHMWTMILKYLSTEAQAQQCQELETKGTVHGKHFNLQGLIKALQMYKNNCNSWNDSQCFGPWCNVVGGEQKLLPMHVVNEYCHPDRAFDPCPQEWKSKLPRTREFYQIYDTDRHQWTHAKGSSWFIPFFGKGGLGFTYAFSRGVGRLEGGMRAPWSNVYNDLMALQSLWQTRTQQLKSLESELLSTKLKHVPLLSGNSHTFMSTPKPAPKSVDHKDLNQLLHYVAAGEQDAAEEQINKDKGLLLLAGTVKDLSGREFKSITPFQYALWAMDWHMWTMIRKYLSSEAQAQQLQELETKGTSYGKHFNVQELIEALRTYSDNYISWNHSQRSDYWSKVVGGEQKLLPAHAVNEYCRPDRAYQIFPSKWEWESKLPRTREVPEIWDSTQLVGFSSYVKGSWFIPTSSKDGLGLTYAFARSPSFSTGRLRCSGITCSEPAAAITDRDAFQYLWKARTQQLELLKNELLSVTNQSQVFGS